MSDQLDRHLIDPPDRDAGGEVVSCHVCDRDFELPATSCPHCGADVDDDSVRDQLEAQNTPPEWT
jgi:predicted amidophosphoribosyltransferase